MYILKYTGANKKDGKFEKQYFSESLFSLTCGVSRNGKRVFHFEIFPSSDLVDWKAH